MNSTLYDPYCVSKSSQSSQPMPFIRQSRQNSQSLRNLQDLPKPRVLEVLFQSMPEWLYLGLKHFGGYIFFIFVLIMFGFVVSAILFH
jgi:hypothetical protein